MFMQKIRRATKKHRKVLTVVVILLLVGLVGSFAVWNSNSMPANANQEATYTEQVQAYENYLAEHAPATVAEADYATAYSIAGYYMGLRSACAGAYQEAYASESEADREAAAQYAARAEEAVDQAVAYYQQALSQAPEGLNDLGLAQLYAELGTAQLYTVEQEGAKASFEQAIALAPDNVSVISSYANYLYAFEGMTAVEPYLTEKLALFEEESEEYSTLSQQIAYYQFLDAYNQAMQDNAAEGDGADEPAANDNADAPADENTDEPADGADEDGAAE